jgi:hypothetical protein
MSAVETSVVKLSGSKQIVQVLKNKGWTRPPRRSWTT